MQNTFNHATIEARRPSRVFRLQRFSRGAQFRVSATIQFLLAQPHDLVGAL
jgi:hypothetical protein